MFCSPSIMVSSRSRLSFFEEKHIRKLLESYIVNISSISDELPKHNYVHKETCLLTQNREICITITIHIHSVTPNATRTHSCIVVPPFLLMILVQNFMLIKNHIKTWVSKSTETKLLTFKDL